MMRFEVYWVNLEPTQGSEIRKIRPCVIVSPDEMNRHLNTLIIAPLSTGGKAYSTRVKCKISGKSGFVVLDQLRTVDKHRLGKHLSTLDQMTAHKVLEVLQEMFSL